MSVHRGFRLAWALPLALAAGGANAALITADWSWTGNAGWRATGVVIFDSSVALPAAEGPLYGDFNRGIDYLDVAFWSPTGVASGAWQNVVNGVVLRQALSIAIDPVNMVAAPGSIFSVGQLTTALGNVLNIILPPEPSIGAPIVVNGRLRDRGPSALAFTARTPPPEDPPPSVAAPAPWSLFVLAAPLLAWHRRRRARHPQPV